MGQKIMEKMRNGGGSSMTIAVYRLDVLADHHWATAPKKVCPNNGCMNMRMAPNQFLQIKMAQTTINQIVVDNLGGLA